MPAAIALFFLGFNFFRVFLAPEHEKKEKNGLINYF